MLPHYTQSRVAQQLVVVQQTARYCILYCSQCNDRRVFLNILEHLLKGVADYQLHMLALEIMMGCDVVARPTHSMFGYSLHFILYILEVMRGSYILEVMRGSYKGKL